MNEIIIIGAGPAGLVAASEILSQSEIKPIIVERDQTIGGLARTLKYDDYLIDIGPHRFFSKSDKVNEWWLKQIDLKTDFLEVNRLTRIFFLKKLFLYPISFSYSTVRQLGLKKTIKIGFSYLKYFIFSIKPEKNLADFYTNRFGLELYNTFFKDYTQKLWGIDPKRIEPTWGAQRVKGLSIASAIKHFVKDFLPGSSKKVEMSLVEKFFYPKFGSGYMWETASQKIIECGGEIFFGELVVELKLEKRKIIEITTINKKSQLKKYHPNYCLSSMSIKDLFSVLNSNEDLTTVKMLADNLIYRDLVNVTVVINKLKIKNPDGTEIKDNWLYIQEPGFKVGRIQIAKNMSPYLSSVSSDVILGLEYFATEGDSIWSMSDEAIKDLAITELVEMGFIDKVEVIKVWIERIKQAYPAYFGGYDKFSILSNFLDSIDNLYPIGRNGMHKYNNMDHSMLTAMASVKSILTGQPEKREIWQINTEQEYHEQK